MRRLVLSAVALTVAVSWGAISEAQVYVPGKVGGGIGIPPIPVITTPGVGGISGFSGIPMVPTLGGSLPGISNAPIPTTHLPSPGVSVTPANSHSISENRERHTERVATATVVKQKELPDAEQDQNVSKIVQIVPPPEAEEEDDDDDDDEGSPWWMWVLIALVVLGVIGNFVES